jgi:hypothetical protein
LRVRNRYDLAVLQAFYRLTQYAALMPEVSDAVPAAAANPAQPGKN